MSDEIASGTIRTKIENLNTWAEDQWHFSTPTTVAGVPWETCAWSKKSDTTNNVRHLGVGLFCNNTSTMLHRWSIHCKATFALIAQDGSSRTYTENAPACTYDNCKKGWGQDKFISWVDLMAESNPWVRNNSTEVEVRFVVIKLEGIDYPLHVSFSSPTEMRADVILLVDGHRIHVNKTILSIHSPVFKDMFFGQHAERTLGEIPIRGVSYNEFHTFLCAIYPTRRRVDDSSVEAILTLANRYDVEKLVHDCEQFLKTQSELSREKKLRLADKCKLPGLLVHCVCLYSTVAELEALKQSDEYAHLSSDSKGALFERCLKVAKIVKREEPENANCIIT